jgi:Beta/Gamma crystallin
LGSAPKGASSVSSAHAGIEGMNIRSRLLLGLALAAAASAASAEAITFFQRDNNRGQMFTTSPAYNFTPFGVNDRASSVSVRSRMGELWVDANLGGRWVALRSGRYASLSAIRAERSRCLDAPGRQAPSPPPPAPPPPR